MCNPLYCRPEVLLRITVNDKSSTCPLSNKFGAQSNTWKDLLMKAYVFNLNVVGVAFHVGSGCTRADSFTEALNDTAELFELSRNLEIQRKTNRTEGILNGKQIDFHAMSIIDIGGGFPGEASNQIFPAMVKQINDFINGEWCKQWTKKRRFEVFQDYELTFIAEPGRFFVHHSSTLITSICGLNVCKDEEKTTIKYYLNDGVYGSFNKLLFPNVRANFKPPLHQQEYIDTLGSRKSILETSLVDLFGRISITKVQENKKIPVFFSQFFGPTCDGNDVIMEIEFPLLAEGEVIVWLDMGAYTQPASSRPFIHQFNGFVPPKKIYLPVDSDKNA